MMPAARESEPREDDWARLLLTVMVGTVLGSTPVLATVTVAGWPGQFLAVLGALAFLAAVALFASRRAVDRRTTFALAGLYLLIIGIATATSGAGDNRLPPGGVLASVGGYMFFVLTIAPRLQ